MNNKELKVLRGQIRQIVKELLPDVLTSEVLLAIEQRLSAQVKEKLEQIDERQKDLQAYMVRLAPKK